MQLHRYATKQLGSSPAGWRKAVEDHPIADGFVILVRKGDVFGAFIPQKQWEKQETAQFKWYFRTDGPHIPRIAVR